MPKSVVSYYPEEIGFPDKSCLIKVLAVLFYVSPFLTSTFYYKNLCIFSGRGYFQNWFGIMPRKKEINVVVGKIN